MIVLSIVAGAAGAAYLLVAGLFTKEVGGAYRADFLWPVTLFNKWRGN